MSPAHVLEPTYATLRRRLLIGYWPAGFRLEAARLASELDVSITPVRDSFNRLAGERLLLAAAGEGFRTPRLDETELKSLLDWHLALLRIAFGRPAGEGAGIVPPVGHDGVAERAALLFITVAALARSGEIDWAVANAAARLGGYRRWEAEVLPDAAAELEAMELAARQGHHALLAALIEQYHLRRRAAAPELVHRAHRA
jgi:hypothetical protein